MATIGPGFACGGTPWPCGGFAAFLCFGANRPAVCAVARRWGPFPPYAPPVKMLPATVSMLLAQAATGGAPNPGTDTAPIFGSPYIMFGVASIFLFYTLVLAPEKRRRAEEDNLRGGLKKNDQVVTAGGIYGTIVSAIDGEDFVTMRIDSNTRMKVSRTAISRVIDPKPDPSEAKSDGD